MNIEYTTKEGYFYPVPQMEKPEIESYSTRGQETPEYNAAIKEYEKYLASLPPLIKLSPEMIAVIKDQPEGRTYVEGVDFGIVLLWEHGSDGEMPRSITVAYPISKSQDEQEIDLMIASTDKYLAARQEDLWNEAKELIKPEIGIYSNSLIETITERVVTKLSKHFTIKRKP